MRNYLSTAIVVAAVALTTACSSPSAPSTGAASFAPAVEAQIEQYRNGVLALYPNANLPQPQIVRLVDPDEHNSLVADCMIEAGYEAKVTSDGGINYGAITLEQEEAMFVAMFTCQASYPIDPKYQPPLTDEQVQILYDYYVNFLTSCVEARDIAVDEAPSFTRFKETLNTEQQWHPYSNVIGLPQTELEDLLEACPQTPEGLR